MNVAELLATSVARFPERDALISGVAGRRDSVTYAELAARVDRAVQVLRDSGLRPERVSMTKPKTNVPISSSISRET